MSYTPSLGEVRDCYKYSSREVHESPGVAHFAFDRVIEQVRADAKREALNVEALAQHLAYGACVDASMEGYGWDENKPEDVEHFYPCALQRAQRYADILLGVKP